MKDYWDATEEFSRDDKGQAGFIAPVGKGPVKGGKPNGVPYNFGKSGTKGKGQVHKGHGFQPERGEQRRLGGYCNWCWRIGHKESQCWFKQEYTESNPPQDPLQRETFANGQIQRRKSKVATSPKVKVTARENIQERIPQPRPA